MTDAAEMPRYKSHKTVHALEISAVEHDAAKQDVVLTFKDDGYAPLRTWRGDSLFARYNPQPGDFYVVYADGYQSFSPRKAFLDGYTRE